MANDPKEEQEQKSVNHPKSLVRSKITTSYGLIVYTFDENQSIRFLMTQRRDTFSYECILRGMYTEDLLDEYISNLTEEERERLATLSFELLWKDLWVSPKRRLYRIEYNKAKQHFEERRHLLIELMNKTPAVGKDIWEFPKGRLFNEESTYQCALREFEEETMIRKSQVTIMKRAGYVEDNYIGTDHRTYRSIYYIGYIENGTKNPFAYQDCPHHVRRPYISDEVMDMKWATLEEALELATPSKQLVIKEAYERIVG
jgi:8-oxo-dGTP pyrophosphatase MutT (NUDIX family)